MLPCKNPGYLVLARMAVGSVASSGMNNRPQPAKKPESKPGEQEKRPFRTNQFEEQRRRDMATRSTLSRLRNRKSDLK